MTRRALIGSLLSVLVPTSSAQPTFPLRDESARLEQVGDGVYAIIHDDATDEWPHGNTGVVVGEHSVLVVDATYLPSRARSDIALIRAITDKPIRYLAYTHWHFDHNNGAIAYREAYPGLAIVSERERVTSSCKANAYRAMPSPSSSERFGNGGRRSRSSAR
jgi:glyoxylase-like metal-dependent hydrolase (beta-lactamase superfamily II)